MGHPEAVAILGDSGGLTPRPREDLIRRMAAAAGRKDDPDRAVLAAGRAPPGALPDRGGGPHRPARPRGGRSRPHGPHGRAHRGQPRGCDRVAADVAAACARPSSSSGMGPRRRRVGYGSDADVLFVHDAHEGASEDLAQDQALEVVQELRRLLGSQGPDPQLGLDADLRPEGKNGRSCGAWRATAPTTSAGPSPGSPRRCCVPRPSPATRTSVHGSSS